ncbi:uncharacterized protein V1516DRAFT_673030 [Lipomyces oligophaga]|uniref:uncharacterized protein n=1 Tax=Lipomyces oligophaga TaxID=45792 RepID=UPI0034CDB204
MTSIKADINKSTWEDTDIPSICERCLGPNPYTLMTRARHDEECKICTRPFTVFRWRPENSGGRYKKNTICNTCARQKNCCQSCMLDLSFGLPIAIRDAALKMVKGSGGSNALTSTTVEPQNIISKQFVAQNIEEKLREAGGEDLSLYNREEEAEEVGKRLLQQLASSQPYYSRSNVGKYDDNKRPKDLRNVVTKSAKVLKNNTKLLSKIASQSKKLTVPSDPKIMSLFLTGVEDDLPEYAIRKYFQEFGTLKSVVCSHRSHCAFINFSTRESAETAAETTGSTVIIDGCPLRVTWGRPRPIDDEDHSLQNAKLSAANKRKMLAEARGINEKSQHSDNSKNYQAGESVKLLKPALPPGQDAPVYASQQPDFEL